VTDGLTDDWRRAIEADCARLIALYANLNDEARWDEAAALYAPDGLMTRPTAPDVPIVGREAILAAFKARPPRTTRHVCSNVVIEVESAREARGTSAMLLFTGAPRRWSARSTIASCAPRKAGASRSAAALSSSRLDNKKPPPLQRRGWGWCEP
jgi:hypothetical protein